MSLKFDMKVTVKGVHNAGDAIRRAQVSALNKTAAQGRTFASRAIRETYNVKSTFLNESKSIKVVKATANSPYALIRAIGRAIPLIEFGARQIRKGVSYMVRKGERKVLAGAFIATMKSGHEGVFMRKGKPRLPIKEQYRISVAEMFGSKDVYAKMTKFVDEKLPEVLDHEIQFYMSQIR